jgi:adenine-specific DNA-methyltransferase
VDWDGIVRSASVETSAVGLNMTFRYIGSKARLVDQIRPFMGVPHNGAFVDAFCGTGAVAEVAADLGWPVRINDSLASATISTAARLTCSQEARFTTLGGYESAIVALNSAVPLHGAIWREYSPASRDFSGFERRYFTEANAAKIDAMRALIAEWSNEQSISAMEEKLLIADLFGALNRVANIAGTFGCFLAKWTPQSQNVVAMRPRQLKTNSTQVETHIGDVFDVPVHSQDVVYLDPPYTKRQYASYYHILETVAFGDDPIVEGVAGLRPWKTLSSDFCYKVRALSTLLRLIQSLPAERILLSYSSEGHVPVSDLRDGLSSIGKTTMHPIGDIGRYRPNKAASSMASEVSEYLIVIEKSKQAALEGSFSAPQYEEVFA